MSSRRTARSIYPLHRRPRSLVVTLLLLVVLGGVAARRFGTPGKPTTVTDRTRYDQRECTVVRVVDGDTIDVDIADARHNTTRIRLWGVDTPEVAGSPRGEMHFGPEASAFTKRAVLNRRVRLALDPEQNSRDRYGRLLAYVYLIDSDTMLNQRLLETGHAYASTFDHVLEDPFREVERRARHAGVGLWADITRDKMPPWRQRYEEWLETRRNDP